MNDADPENHSVSPGVVGELGTAFWSSKVLLSAVEVGLFKLLSAEGGADLERICEQLSLHQVVTRDFLDALVSLEVLERQGGVYKNTPAAENFLNPVNPGPDMSGFLTILNWQFPVWAGLTDLLRTGESKLGEQGEDPFEHMYNDPELSKLFLGAMDSLTEFVAPVIASKIDWSGIRSFVDAGGSRGTFASKVVEAVPHLTGTVVDLPHLRPHFEARVAELGSADKVNFLSGDFFTEALPKADAVVFGHILHDWTPKQREQLLQNAYSALPPGGLIAVYDAMLDNERRANQFGLLLSLSMRLISEHGAEYTVDELHQQLTEAGFSSIETMEIGQTDTLCVAKK